MQARELHDFGGPVWARALRIIHFEFDSVAAESGADDNQCYCLASDLLDEESVNAVVMLRFSADWRTIVGRRVVPLPTQDCSCHRVALASPAGSTKRRSIL